MTGRHLGLSLGFAALVGCGEAEGGAVIGPRSEAPPGLWDTWGDGRAELAGYHLVTPRYGAPRDGYAVLVFVTETFTAASRVKSDGGHHDELPVMKLNEVRHFQTGVYDYDLMTSTFAPLDGSTPRGVPTKVAFGSQEWCGNLYDQLIVDPRTVHRTRHSYFDGEADLDETFPLPSDVIFADALPIAVRGLTGAWLEPGETRSVRLLPTLGDTQLQHAPLGAVDATLTGDGDPHDVTVPAGTFTVRSTSAAIAGGLTTTWDVEEAAPHRIIAWRRSDGEVAELTGSTRLAYWSAHDPGDEGHLAELGLGALLGPPVSTSPVTP